MNFVRNHRKGLTVGGIIGLCVALPAAALAAFFLSTTVQGSTAYADSTVSMEVTAASASAETGGVTCAATKLGGNSVKIDPKVKRIVNGNQSQTIPGTCKVNVTFKNTGSEKIELAGAQFTTNPPAGWALPTSSFTGATSLNPGQTGTLTATVTANDDAKLGPFAFRIDWKPANLA